MSVASTPLMKVAPGLSRSEAEGVSLSCEEEADIEGCVTFTREGAESERETGCAVSAQDGEPSR